MKTLILDDSHAGDPMPTVARGTCSPVPALPEMSGSLADSGSVHRTVLLVGSPRTKKSISASLGGYMLERLAAWGIETEMIPIYTSFSSLAKTHTA